MRRKIPKLYITAQTNSMQKGFGCGGNIEHNMRVYNKEHLPGKPYVLVPSFQLKKDNIANTVIAYMVFFI
jgi:hypothetical protein